MCTKPTLQSGSVDTLSCRPSAACRKPDLGEEILSRPCGRLAPGKPQQQQHHSLLHPNTSRGKQGSLRGTKVFESLQQGQGLAFDVLNCERASSPSLITFQHLLRALTHDWCFRSLIYTPIFVQRIGLLFSQHLGKSHQLEPNNPHA